MAQLSFRASCFIAREESRGAMILIGTTLLEVSPPEPSRRSALWRISYKGETQADLREGGLNMVRFVRQKSPKDEPLT
jgi:predicted fused transcriptional regulator/phosphomethylpyrimidine kinase